MAYNVLEVAQHVINQSIEIEKPVTNLKLQKLLYYIQASFLTTYGEPCFNEEIENWRHGPVVPVVYSEYKGYTNKPINERQSECIEMFINSNGNFAAKKVEYNKVNFEDMHLKLINKVINIYKNSDPWDMVDRTHEELPWKNTKQNEIITRESIMEYFKHNTNRIYGGKCETVTR